jgi:hypothetical protein
VSVVTIEELGVDERVLAAVRKNTLQIKGYIHLVVERKSRGKESTLGYCAVL